MVGMRVMNKLKVLYEDNHLIAVEKPCNVLSQADHTNDLDILTMVKQYIKEKYNKPGNVYLGLVHRLDRPVGGVMVFARTTKAARRLSNQIKNHELRKTYLAVVWGLFDKLSGEYQDYIMKKDDGTSIITDEEHGKLAVLSYEVLQQNKDKNLAYVKINLKTGRHHQIRVQFASHKHPLYGDQRYGKIDKEQICLYAHQISFYHPITKELISLTSYPAKKGGWTYFAM